MDQGVSRPVSRLVSRRWRVARPFVSGLALGGGAARGLAHIGVLKVLVAEGYLPQVLVGTSAGALVGAAYACHGSMQTVEELFVAFASGDRFRKSSFAMFRQSEGRRTFFQSLTQLVKKGVVLGVSITKPSFIGEETFQQDLQELLPNVSIEELPLRFAAIATDIVAGNEVVLRSGDLRKAIAASCALPGILPPVPYEGTTLIDGGSVNKVPASTVRRLGADFVVAVDIHASLESEPALSRGIDIVNRSHAITGHTLRRFLLREADVVIRPQVGHVHWADFGRYAELIRAGEEAARSKVPEIRRRLRIARLRARLLPWTRPRLDGNAGEIAPSRSEEEPGILASVPSPGVAARPR